MDKIKFAGGPSCTIWAPTAQLRWMLSPTPGERPQLQQLHTCIGGEIAPGAPTEEWRFVPYVDWNERNVV